MKLRLGFCIPKRCYLRLSTGSAVLASPIRSSHVGIRTIRYLQGSRKSVARRSTRTPWDLLQQSSTWHSTTRILQTISHKASNYKHVLPSQLAGLAGGKSSGIFELWSSIAYDFSVPLKCTTRVCSPLHTGQLRIAKTLRILLDPPHHTLLLPARL